MRGMIDGRRLKRAWDNNELGSLLLGHPPYEYEDGSDTQAKFTRLRQVVDFLRCRAPLERKEHLVAASHLLDKSEEGWAKAASIFLRQSFGELRVPGDESSSEQPPS